MEFSAEISWKINLKNLKESLQRHPVSRATHTTLKPDKIPTKWKVAPI